jgi:hypothetical protein
MREILLLHVTGEDRPGLTATLTSLLVEHDIHILDLNQTVIHRTLLMGMLYLIGIRDRDLLGATPEPLPSRLPRPLFVERNTVRGVDGRHSRPYIVARAGRVER